MALKPPEVAKRKPRRERRVFLDFDKYIERFVKDVLALQRLWFFPLALCAFWLAIENSYRSFTELRFETYGLDTSKKEYDRLAAGQRRSKGGSGDRPVAGGPPAASEEAPAGAGKAADGADASADIARQKEKIERQKDKIDKLKDEALDLTIAGTVMPSRLAYAPTLWLVALFAWLLLFERLKSRARTNLAAAAAASDPAHRPFGLAEESSIWLAPLPDEVVLRAGGEAKPVHVAKVQLQSLLGWSAEDEARSRLLGAVVWLGLAGVTLRILWVAADVTGRFAVAAGIVGTAGSLVNLLGASLFGALCLLVLLRLSVGERGGRPAEMAVPRRDFFAVAGGAVALLLLMTGKSRLEGLVAARPTGKKAASGRPGGQPRFRTREAKGERLANYRIDLRIARRAGPTGEPDYAKPGDILIHGRPSREAAPDGRHLQPPHAIHGVGSNGAARYYAKVDHDHLKGIWRTTPAALRELAAYPHAIPDTVHTAPLEAAALALLESEDSREGDRFHGACDILLGACRLSARARRPSLRLFDLLARVATYYGGTARTDYLAELNALAASIQARSDLPRGWGAISARQAYWKSRKWREKIRTQATLRWGHPFERALRGKGGRARSPGRFAARLVVLRLTPRR
jgi:hypothetical protein